MYQDYSVDFDRIKFHHQHNNTCLPRLAYATSMVSVGRPSITLVEWSANRHMTG